MASLCEGGNEPAGSLKAILMDWSSYPRHRYRDNDPHFMQFELLCKHKEGRFHCCYIPVNALCKAKRTVFANPNRKTIGYAAIVPFGCE
ncbi:hypothetical protein ANN_11392 [Periplaneta americana]|uniref:Uncharacterized protein n=1 Tax=Periplaneta americana TaxID=6978 RepID=A0ABQ8T4W5_PERAM|nr:hypothetical protein ANN_11392 [Periplaneta americana]